MDIQEKIHSTFAAVATSMGYNEVHGRIISVLMVAGKPLSSEELSRETGYSPSAISLSLDLLELVGIIKKLKNVGDRRVYAQMDGDLLEGLRNAFFFKIKKSIASTLSEFERHRNSADVDTLKTIEALEHEVRRFDEYIDRLIKVEPPK
jgi:DNA-binding transcriptional regulator GbsR (MarR family)